jgi:hypothetical protein
VDLSRGWRRGRRREPAGVFDTLDDVVEDLVRDARKTKTKKTEQKGLQEDLLREVGWGGLGGGKGGNLSRNCCGEPLWWGVLGIKKMASAVQCLQCSGIVGFSSSSSSSSSSVLELTANYCGSRSRRTRAVVAAKGDREQERRKLWDGSGGGGGVCGMELLTTSNFYGRRRRVIASAAAAAVRGCRELDRREISRDLKVAASSCSSSCSSISCNVTALLLSPRKSRRWRSYYMGSKSRWQCMYNVVVVQAEMQEEEIGTGLEDNKNKTQQEEMLSSAGGFEQNGRRDFATAATTNGFSSRETSAVLQEEKAAAEAEVLVTSETGTSGRTRKPRTPRPNAGRTSTRRKKSSKTATQEDVTDTETDGFCSGFSPSEVGTDVEFSDGGEVRDSRSGSEAEVVSGDGYGMSSSSSRPSAAAGRRVLLQRKDKINGNVRIRVDGKRDSRFSRGGGGEEKELRFMFLEAIMERARNSDVAGAEEAMSEMQIAGLQAGPRAYHGLIVAYTRAGDTEGGVCFAAVVLLLSPSQQPSSFNP